tara:strand:- start:814 stop:1047 length:234 start_codon:yes stop_codon:yes gene_type:complete
MIDKMNGEISGYKTIKDLCKSLKKISHGKELDNVIGFCDRMIEQLQETVDGAIDHMHSSVQKRLGKTDEDISDETIN